jgi:hypothetical protein
MTLNPYESPREVSREPGSKELGSQGPSVAMTILRGFAITVASAAAFGVVGSVLGLLIGIAAPDYYHTVFRVPSDADVDVLQVGFGLGLTQGVGTGIGVGLVIVVVVAWYNARVRRQSEAAMNP